jgi:hypothetical protein
MQVLLARIIVCFWKQFYGVCGLGHHGAICQLISAIGTALRVPTVSQMG